MRSRRESRAAGVGRSLGAARPLVKCAGPCGRTVPAHVTHPIRKRKGKRPPRLVCADCYWKWWRGEWRLPE